MGDQHGLPFNTPSSSFTLYYSFRPSHVNLLPGFKMVARQAFLVSVSLYLASCSSAHVLPKMGSVSRQVTVVPATTAAPPVTTAAVDDTETMTMPQVVPSMNGTVDAARVCTPRHDECSSEDDCCEDHTCITAKWLNGKQICLPVGPKCYEKEQRCEGASGFSYVPPSPCCDTSLTCAEDATIGWGKFCIAHSAGSDEVSVSESTPEATEEEMEEDSSTESTPEPAAVETED